MDKDLFNAGQRPAIDAGLSVSRVGGAAQTKAMKQVASSLKIDLANFNEMKSFSQFGSDLDASTQKILNHGEVLLQVLRQGQYAPYPMEKEIFELFAAKYGYLDNVKLDKVKEALGKCFDYVKGKDALIFDDIRTEKIINKENEEKLKKLIEEFFKVYEKDYLR